jgi:hypothetical protein
MRGGRKGVEAGFWYLPTTPVTDPIAAVRQFLDGAVDVCDRRRDRSRRGSRAQPFDRFRRTVAHSFPKRDGGPFDRWLDEPLQIGFELNPSLGQ